MIFIPFTLTVCTLRYMIETFKDNQILINKFLFLNNLSSLNLLFSVLLSFINVFYIDSLENRFYIFYKI